MWPELPDSMDRLLRPQRRLPGHDAVFSATVRVRVLHQRDCSSERGDDVSGARGLVQLCTSMKTALVVTPSVAVPKGHEPHHGPEGHEEECEKLEDGQHVHGDR